MGKLRQFEHVAVEADRGQRLDQVLAARLPSSKGRARALIVAGAVYLNGKRVRIASKTILPGARIKAFVDDEKLAGRGPSRDRAFTLTEEHILYEDADVIAVNKPAGLPTQPTLDEARENLYGALRRFLSARDGADSYVGLHHRLDRDTSGVMIFTKRKEANAAVGRIFAEHEARKTYVCIVPRRGRAKPPAKQWTVKNFLARAPGAKRAAKMRSVRSGGDSARTDFLVLEETPGGWLIEARPHTGRMHQIRVHLAEAGLAIWGDAAYRTTPEVSGEAEARVMLHAVSLTFPHPVTTLKTSVSSPIPEDFNTCLAQLRRAP